jgi:hypothetical protein
MTRSGFVIAIRCKPSRTLSASPQTVSSGCFLNQLSKPQPHQRVIADEEYSRIAKNQVATKLLTAS